MLNGVEVYGKDGWEASGSRGTLSKDLEEGREWPCAYLGKTLQGEEAKRRKPQRTARTLLWPSGRKQTAECREAGSQGLAGCCQESGVYHDGDRNPPRGFEQEGLTA